MALPPDNNSLDLPLEDERQSIAGGLQPLEWALTGNLTPVYRAAALQRVFLKYTRLFEIAAIQYGYLHFGHVAEIDPNDPLLAGRDAEMSRRRVRAAKAAHARLRAEKLAKLQQVGNGIRDRILSLVQVGTMLDRPVEFRAAMRAWVLDR